MISCNGKTRATSSLEKAFIEAGGGDPEQFYNTEELGNVLVEAVHFMDDHKPDMLYRLMTTFERCGDIPPGTADGYFEERFGIAPSDNNLMNDKWIAGHIIPNGPAGDVD